MTQSAFMLCGRTLSVNSVMTYITVFTLPLQLRFRSSLISKATAFNIVIYSAILLLPYLLAHRTEGFWQTLETVREQPEVKFKHRALIILETYNVDDEKEQSYIWSTYQGIKKFVPEQLAPTIFFREGDYNRDGKNDDLEINMEIPLPEEIIVHNLHLFLVFQYRLKDSAVLDMESLAYVPFISTRRANLFQFSGKLELSTKQPLTRGIKDDRYAAEVIPMWTRDIGDYTIKNILDKYMARNVSTVFVPDYSLWLKEKVSGNNFIVEGKVRYVEQLYQCWTGLVNSLKWAWIQYLAVFVVVRHLLRNFQKIVYKARLFETILVFPWNNGTFK